MYSKEVTGWIDECWAKGFTAEQTVEAIHKKHDIKLGIATVYRRRHSRTTHELVEELMRQQQFDITISTNEELKLKYRNELLKIFIPQMAIVKNINETESTVKHVIEFVDPDNPAPTYSLEEIEAAKRIPVLATLNKELKQ